MRRDCKHFIYPVQNEIQELDNAIMRVRCIHVRTCTWLLVCTMRLLVCAPRDQHRYLIWWPCPLRHFVNHPLPPLSRDLVPLRHLAAIITIILYLLFCRWCLFFLILMRKWCTKSWHSFKRCLTLTTLQYERDCRNYRSLRAVKYSPHWALFYGKLQTIIMKGTILHSE